MLTMCDQVFDEKRDLFLLVHNKMFSPVIAAGTPKPKTRSKLHRLFSSRSFTSQPQRVLFIVHYGSAEECDGPD